MGKFKGGGIRECFTPRPGRVFASCDVDQLELRTLAQSCIVLLGKSELGRVINSGMDPHTMLACEIVGIPYDVGIVRKEDPEDKEFDNMRQTAKVANFGLPGGLGPVKLVLFARKTYHVDLSIGAGPQEYEVGKFVYMRPWVKAHGPEEAMRRFNELGEAEVRAAGAAVRLKDRWLSRWPEMEDYFRHIDGLKNPRTKLYDLVQLFSHRYRGGAKYTAACNSFFQGLGSDATGRGGWLVARACYSEPSSPLFGCRPVNYVHDDLLVEMDPDRAPEAAEEMSRLFVKGINEFLPDVPATAKPLLTKVWSKRAKRLVDEKGRLTVWEPK